MAITQHQPHPGTDEERSDAPWTGRRFTVDEFLALPDESPHLEFDDGVVTQKVAAKPVHGSVQGLLTILFNQVAHAKRLGVAYPDTRFVTPTWAPVPDVAYYRRGRIHRRGRRLPADFFEPPDLAVEIVSPEQSVTDQIKKCLRYIALGVAVALLVDPDPETVLVFRPRQPLLLLQGDDRIDLDDVLPGFEQTVNAMFDAVAPDWLDEDAEELPDSAASSAEHSGAD